MEEFRKSVNQLFRRPMILFHLYSLMHFVYEAFLNREHPIALQLLLFFAPMIYLIFYTKYPDSILEEKMKYYYYINTALIWVCNILFFIEGRFVYIANIFVVFLFLFANLMIHPRHIMVMGIILFLTNTILFFFLMDIYLLNQILLVALFGIGGPLTSLKILYPYLREQEIEFEKKINRFQFTKLVSQQNSIFIFEDLLSNLIHDVNNSLTGVINFSDFICDEVENQPSNEVNDRITLYSNQLQNESGKIEKKMKLLSQLSHTELKYENLVSIGLVFEHMNSLVATGLKKTGIKIEYQRNNEIDEVMLKFDFRILLITVIKCISLLKSSVIFDDEGKRISKKIIVEIDFNEKASEIVAKISMEGGKMENLIQEVLDGKISINQIFNNEPLRNNKAVILALSLVNSTETNPIYLSKSFNPDGQNGFEIRIVNQRIDFES